MIQRIYVLVEGQTEESFVRDVLSPGLAAHHKYLTPILLTTKRVKNQNTRERALPGRRFKGGVSKYALVKRDIRNVLQDRQATAVTTMIDFYGLPSDFPGMDSLPDSSGYEKVQHLEQALAVDIGDSRFYPFLTLHEFEVLLFTNTGQIAEAFPNQKSTKPLAAIRKAFHSPEDINQGQTTHPAARIINHVSGYQKPFHGPLIAQRIGLHAIRQECPHFNQWVSWLVAL